MLRKLLSILLRIVVFFLITIGSMHFIALMSTRDLMSGEKAFKNEFYIVLTNASNKDWELYNIYNNDINISNFILEPTKNNQETQIEEQSYSYKILSRTDNKLRIETEFKTEDYTLRSTYSVRDNNIILAKSYLLSVDYIFVSMFISLCILAIGNPLYSILIQRKKIDL
ncbi:hypothetical protein [Wohlfahrtiimonas populi]|uniref:hypothetical protein n=1 Tax=Wohlfahrtiimonas populi TaxID=1940240 RepID=UPI00098D0047|nr:hypothetical protein [Wohlfahrtiimonas populi]